MMGKHDANAVNGENKKPASNQTSQQFFGQRPTHQAETQNTEQPQQPQQQAYGLILEGNIEHLLAAILQKLNYLAFMMTHIQEQKMVKEQNALQKAEEEQAEDDAKFEQIKSSMYL